MKFTDNKPNETTPYITIRSLTQNQTGLVDPASTLIQYSHMQIVLQKEGAAFTAGACQPYTRLHAKISHRRGSFAIVHTWVALKYGVIFRLIDGYAASVPAIQHGMHVEGGDLT